MLRLPLMLIGVSLGQLFYNKASELYNQGKSMVPLLNKMLLVLTGLSIVPFSILFFYGEFLFAFVFGKNWALSGSYSETMSVWLMINFILSPIAALPLILSKQKVFFIMGIVSSLIQVIPLWILPMKLGKTQAVFHFSLQIISYTQAAWLLITIGVFYYYALKAAPEKIAS
jgi:O-antigen/teichoic acid export membrane protein